MKSITVIIPTRGLRDDWLKETIKSLEEQTFKDFETVIADGKGTVYNRLNKSMKEANSKYILLLSDDDTLEPNFLEETVSAMSKYDVDIVATFLSNFGAESGKHGPEKHPFFSSLFKKELFDRVGGFDKEMLQMADVDFWVRCFAAGARWCITPNTFYNYRKHGDQDSGTANWDIARAAYLKKHGKFID